MDKQIWYNLRCNEETKNPGRRGKMSQISISAGKKRKIKLLADSDGKFRMMAIDQRGSMVRMLSKILGVDPSEIKYEDLAKTKMMITKVLSPYSSATLTDPVYGYPYSVDYIPKDVGLLLAFEETGYERAGSNGLERRSRQIEGWSVEKAVRAGANAIKLLIYYRPEASDETLQHQQNFVRFVGQECEKYDIPFLLELVGYPLLEDEIAASPDPAKPTNDTPVYAKRKPEIVRRTAEEFSKPEYKVDILKLEFPADLKYTEEYCKGTFDGKHRKFVYNLSAVRDFCKAVDEASQVPWVILSAGVDIEEFVENVKFATEAGASGLLCGRAIWKEAVNFYPDLEAMEKWLMTSGVNNFKKIYEVYTAAKPWFEHRKFKSYADAGFGSSGEWYKNYGS
ncbi:TPA: tagatose 1,6-diphosphate aldolase [Candidatus Poribacteria bacterium]|nr:tagatose 1,6-diphosphate aldolase [Candidatus Poribacteria bacterium]